MTIYFEQECAADFPFDCEKVAEEVTEAVLDYVNCPYEAEVSVILTDDVRIREINKEHRGIDAATDVLSFPMTQYEVPGDFSFLEEEQAGCFNPESGELMLGDIVISAGRVKSQAVLYGHGELREYAFLLAHSLFHLIGYDHMTSEEAAVMEKKQGEVLAKMGITRE